MACRFNSRRAVGIGDIASCYFFRVIVACGWQHDYIRIIFGACGYFDVTGEEGYE